jgi:hypothetical protein
MKIQPTWDLKSRPKEVFYYVIYDRDFAWPLLQFYNNTDIDIYKAYIS